MRKVRARLAVVATTAVLIVSGNSVAQAAVPTTQTAVPASAQVCSDYGTHYSTSGLQTNIFIPTGIDWKSGPGGTVTSSIENSQTATMSVNIGVSVTYSAIVASAQATFGISAAQSSTRSQTYTYSHAVTSGTYGHLQFGNWGYRMTVRKWVVDTACNVTSDTTGTVTRMPSTSSWGFQYWETAV